MCWNRSRGHPAADEGLPLSPSDRWYDKVQSRAYAQRQIREWFEYVAKTNDSLLQIINILFDLRFPENNLDSKGVLRKLKNRKKYDLISESPDIIVPDLSIGVEVTNCLIRSVHEKIAYSMGISDGRIDPDEHPDLSGDMDIGELSNGQKIASFAIWGSQYDMLEAFKKKTVKLNKPHFTRCKENNLLISAWMIREYELEPELNGIFHLNQELKGTNLESRFDNLYILTDRFMLLIRPEDERQERIMLSNATLTELSEQAFIRVMGMSREAYYEEQSKPCCGR